MKVPMAPIGVVNWHIGRCGSSVLGSLLAQHPEITYSNEIFSPYMPRRRGGRTLPPLEEVVERARDGLQTRFHLFEVKHLQEQNLGLYPGLSRSDWVSRFASLGCQHHLVMRRRNGLRRMVSHVRASSSGVYVSSASASPPSQAVTIPLENIVHGFRQRSLLEWLEVYEEGHVRMQEALSDAEVPSLELVYEEDLEDSPLQAYQRVCQFLELEPGAPELRYRKINRGKLSDLIANFDAIESCLATTRFAWMLDA